MAQSRSRRLRLLESLRRTINEMLHEKVQRAATARGHGAPQNTQSIYTSATDEVPELLDQLFFVHRRVGQEKGEDIATVLPGSLDHSRRKAMLSAVRAAVKQSNASFEG